MPYVLFVVILNSMNHVPVVSRGQPCFTHPPSQEHEFGIKDFSVRYKAGYFQGVFSKGNTFVTIVSLLIIHICC